MEITKLTAKAKRDFNNAICLIGIIPTLAFVYLLTERISSLDIFAGRRGFIAFLAIIIFLSGFIMGKRMLWSLILKLLDFNQKIIAMQDELIIKNKLAAITETVLTLGHEINNPLLIIRGNLEILGQELRNAQIPHDLNERVVAIKTNFDRIGEVTEKMSRLSKPISDTVYGNTKMFDLRKSS